jgi:hypothetical protein
MNSVYVYINALLTDLINSSVTSFLLTNLINHALLKIRPLFYVGYQRFAFSAFCVTFYEVVPELVCKMHCNILIALDKLTQHFQHNLLSPKYIMLSRTEESTCLILSTFCALHAELP